jgi:hypothetical protein
LSVRPRVFDSKKRIERPGTRIHLADKRFLVGLGLPAPHGLLRLLDDILQLLLDLRV